MIWINEGGRAFEQSLSLSVIVWSDLDLMSTRRPLHVLLNNKHKHKKHTRTRTHTHTHTSCKVKKYTLKGSLLLSGGYITDLVHGRKSGIIGGQTKWPFYVHDQFQLLEEPLWTRPLAFDLQDRGDFGVACNELRILRDSCIATEALFPEVLTF